MDRADRLQLIGSLTPADGEIPVPKGHTDEAYCARIADARRFADDFGRSAECGWGRTEPGHPPGLLEAHRVAAEAF